MTSSHSSSTLNGNASSSSDTSTPSTPPSATSSSSSSSSSSSKSSSPSSSSSSSSSRTSSSDSKRFRPSPEPTANPLSWLFYTWLNSLMLMGSRRLLEETDMYELRDDMEASRLSERFQSEWQVELQKQKTVDAQIRSAKEKGMDGKNLAELQLKLRKQGASLPKALWRIFKTDYSIAGFFMAFIAGVQFLQPYLLQWFLQWIVSFLTQSPEPVWKGYVYAAFMFICPFINTVMMNIVMRLCYGVGMNVRSILITSLFQKALRLSPKSRTQMSTGQIVNMMSTDASKIDLVLQWFHMGWTSFLQLIVAIALLINAIGVSALAGLACIIVILPLQGKIASQLQFVRRESLKLTDARVKLMNEILQGVRVIKVYAWEKPFARKLADIRLQEMAQILKGNYIRAINSSVMQVAPMLMSIVAYIVLAAINGDLNPAYVFSSLVLFNILRMPLMMVPMILAFTVDSFVSLDRIQKFLLAEELQTPPALTTDQSYAIKIESGEFTWEIVQLPDSDPSQQQAAPGGAAPAFNGNTTRFPADKKLLGNGYSTTKMTGEQYKQLSNKEKEVELTSTQSTKSLNSLSKADTNGSHTSSSSSSSSVAGVGEESMAPSLLVDINVTIPRNKLTMIVGAVGSGKSSLLNAIIGEMKRLNGQVSISGTVGYVSQQAWIQNSTLRDNIVFGLPFDATRYAEAIRVSCLEPDLAVLPGGDMTEIGEKGINLSGGQKQRVSLARAVYFGADIVLLDDPLSALDAHVGKAVFEGLVMGALHDKTRVLVTHQLQYAAHADLILFMKGGKIAEMGTFAQLSANRGEFAKLMDTYVGSGTDSENEGEGAGEKKGKKVKEEGDGKAKVATTLMTTEERARGGLALHVYWYYVKALGGPFIVLLAVGFLGTAQGLSLETNYWLSAWTANQYNHGTSFYMWIYAMLGGVQCIMLTLSILLVTKLAAMASIRLHDQSFISVLHAPMSFFDTTPLGRIVNRFSKDQDVVDTLLMDSVRMFLGMFLLTIGTIVLIGDVQPFFLIGLVPLAILYLWVQSVYRRSSREVKRLDAITRSPLFAHFSETLTGLPTIRAYRQADRFIHENFNRLNGNNRPYFVSQVSQRWLAQYLEMLGALLILMVALIACIQHDSSSGASPGQLGLILSYAMNITSMLSWMIRQSVEAENYFNSVERSEHYTERLPREAAYNMPELDQQMDKKQWPQRGEVRFENVAMRYREGLPLVLDHINAVIKPGEKVGVVGRTGAGKSSMMIALFRLVEASDGEIKIDGVNIRTLGLQLLRSKMAIIPQDPVLYSGTLRSNLDPFGDYNDEQLWAVLRKCFLFDAVSAMDGQLDAVVAENGENLSVGQRCQVCLGRAMLRNSKILIMDEATASVDLQTDAWIQKSLREQFSCTILTIAHRLNTIIDYDRVMVLSQGKIVEFDSPAQLLRNPTSIFTALVNETGVDNAVMLKRLAFAREAGVAINVAELAGTLSTDGTQENGVGKTELQPKRKHSVSHSVHFHF